MSEQLPFNWGYLAPELRTNIIMQMSPEEVSKLAQTSAANREIVSDIYTGIDYINTNFRHQEIEIEL